MYRDTKGYAISFAGRGIQIAQIVVDTDSNLLTATPAHFSFWAVLGETNRSYLPIILRGNGPSVR